MCILCVIQKWSRQVATMLPWLVIPLIGLWALSQLLPPAFRFEITSPRLACVFVLLVTMFWYEILMPQLSAWRTRRNARLREKKRFEAIELQKLRKTATRRCRNCLTPYRDQNPGDGKFMCASCGHISKRPVLDLPVLPGLGMSNSGLIKDLVGKGGKMLNGKACPDNGWMYSQDWMENGSWSGVSTEGKSNYWQKKRGGFGDENCLAEKSYLGGLVFVCKLLTSFYVIVRWLWRKIFRISSSEDASSGAEHRAILAKRGHVGTNFNESRGDRARRKAEEKRQARLEKELLEEEERKQREEVARLVEERRKLRDEKMEVEKDGNRLSTHNREKDSKKEAEKKRQERRKGKDKDKGSSKSNSDVEELEKKVGKESDRRQVYDMTIVNDHQEHPKSGTESLKGQKSDSGHGAKKTSYFSRGNAGTRYLDKMRGKFLSPSKAFSGSVFFGKTANSPATVIKENKLGSVADHVQRDIRLPESQAGKPRLDGDDKSINHPVLSESQSRTSPMKSWRQLFTRSSSALTSYANVISRPKPKPQVEVQNQQIAAQSSPIASFDNPIDFGLPSPFMDPAYTNASSFGSLGFSQPVEPFFPRAVEGNNDFIPEEPELFEDPCFIADEMSLLGPVSELFATDVERPNSMKNLSVSHEMSKPSPIESPMSRLRVIDEKHNGSTWFPTSPRGPDFCASAVDDVHVNEKGTWQMWNSSLFQEALGMVGGPGSWLLAPKQNSATKEDTMKPPSHKTMASLFVKDDQFVSAPHSPHKVLGNGESGGMFSPVTSPIDNGKWVHNAFFPPLSGNNDHFFPTAQDEKSLNEMVYSSPSAAATIHHYEPPPANCWSNSEEWAMQGPRDDTGQPVPRPGVGGLFPASDVQSLWSFD